MLGTGHTHCSLTGFIWALVAVMTYLKHCSFKWQSDKKLHDIQRRCLQGHWAASQTLKISICIQCYSPSSQFASLFQPSSRSAAPLKSLTYLHYNCCLRHNSSLKRWRQLYRRSRATALRLRPRYTGMVWQACDRNMSPNRKRAMTAGECGAGRWAEPNWVFIRGCIHGSCQSEADEIKSWWTTVQHSWRTMAVCFTYVVMVESTNRWWSTFTCQTLYSTY